MVATLVRLRWRLTLNTLRTDAWAAVGTALALCCGAGAVLTLSWGAAALGAWAPQAASPVLAGLGALTVIGWVVVPLLMTGADSMIDPRALAPWIAPSRGLAAGLAVASACGVPGLSTAVVLCLPALVWAMAGHGASALLALALAPAALGTCVLASQIIVVGVGVSTSRRGRDLVALVGGVVVLAAAFIPSVINALEASGNLDLSRLDAAGRALGLTPMGWATNAPGLLAQGRTGPAVAMAVGAVVLPLALVPLWGRVVARVMTGPARSAGRRASERMPAGAAASGGALPWQRRLARIAPGPAAAVAARCLRYWRTDPRYFVVILSVLVIPVLILAVGVMGLASGSVQVDMGDGAWALSWGLGQAPVPLLGLPPFLALMCAWAVHDDLAYDSTALWTHVSAGLRGRDDLAGRALAMATWQMPVVLVLTVVCAAWTGRWPAAPAVLGASLGAYGAALAWSCGTCVLMPYLTHAPGENPMKSRGSGMTMIAGLLQTIGLLIIMVMAAPVLVGLVLVLAHGAWAWSPVLLVLGASWGAGLAWAGIVWAGGLLDRRYVPVLTTIRSWPGHGDAR
ncbi:MAG: transporter [Actinomyces sp.]|uniref:transporter n=1 Tax=Actinomyces sp. TaxID=29317 RepID=UPI0026DC1014|nr:transporter [Actinomyces sp.]MDO4243390.1 transporter [Actinomyces sp.]